MQLKFRYAQLSCAYIRYIYKLTITYAFVNEYITQYGLFLLLRISELVKIDIFGEIYSSILCKNTFFRLLSNVFQFIILNYPAGF